MLSSDKPFNERFLNVTKKCYFEYNFAPSGLFEFGMNVKFVAGTFQIFADIPGMGNTAAFNGILGVVLDFTEKFAFISSSEGKKIRTISLSSSEVGQDITCK
jgi:hypothetical protein